MHHVGRLTETAAVTDPYGSHCSGLTRRAIVDRAAGSSHQEIHVAELDPGGRIDRHLHAHEEALYVLEGALSLTVGDAEEELGADDFLFVDAAVAHAVSNGSDTPARWLEVAAPQSGAGLDEPAFVDGSVAGAAGGAHHRGHFDVGQLPEPSGAIGLAGFGEANVGGAALKMLVEGAIGATQLNLFVVQYQPGGFIREHDHPFEEAFFFVSGEIEAVLDGETHALAAGDYCWSSSGSMHAFTNRTDAPVRWLETQVPQPPGRYQARFVQEWERTLRGEPSP
jgi:quercetin dioxygenase-like cupin family protein